jgi:fumarate reductase subunit C
MSSTTPVTVEAVPATATLTGPARSAWPARLDVLQSATGLLLGLFMWVHMLFVASILLGPDAMWTVARFFEGYFFFGRAVPGAVAALVAVVILPFYQPLASKIVKYFPSHYYFCKRRRMGCRVKQVDYFCFSVCHGILYCVNKSPLPYLISQASMPPCL